MFRTTAFIIILSASAVSGLISEIATTESGESKVVAGRIAPPRVELETETEAHIEIVTVELTDDEQALVDWARGRFAEAGLDLPEMVVRFDPTKELCNNAEGLYQLIDGTHVATICTRDSDTFAAQLDRRRTLLHEFGHAWDTVNLSDDDREHIGDILEAAAWYDHELAWEDRGVERFAETFVYNLLDQPARQLKVGLQCADLISAFTTATDSGPLGPGIPTCAEAS